MLRLGFHRDGFARGIWAGRLLIMIAVGLRTELLWAFCVIMFSLFSLARVLDLCGMNERFNTWIFFFSTYPSKLFVIVSHLTYL